MFVFVGVIAPLCELFTCPDPKIIMVAMEGIENILRVGKVQQEQEAPHTSNKFAEYVEECGGLDNLEALQRHDNEEIYEKAVKILRMYFESEDEEETNVAPAVAQDASAFVFGAPQGGAPGGGFSFGQ
jgi:hypothetical protein